MDVLSIVIFSAVAFIIAILSGLGVGSGGLFLIWLTSIAGIDPISARGMNLLFFVFSASAALFLNLKNKCIQPKELLLPCIPAVFGAMLGISIGGVFSAARLRRIFGIILVFSGVRTFNGKRIYKAIAKKEKV